MYKLARSAMFSLSAETAHDIALDMIGAGGRLGLTKMIAPKVPSRPREVMGITFDNPVGLGSGSG